MDLDTIAKSAGIALALTVAACVWLARQYVRQVDHNFEKDKIVADLTHALKESTDQMERLWQELRERDR